ncbi:ATP-dependent DNA helicase RecG [bacterium]|nr:ATP-dependent DNA helicase RecG [bacterium]
MTRLPRLDDNVQFLKGVGPRKGEILAKRGIETNLDLLYTIPRDYLDLRQVRPIAQMAEDEVQLLRGKIFWLDFRRTKTGMPLVEMQCTDGSGELTVQWFHRPDLRETLAIDQHVEITGKPKRVEGHWRMTNPKIRPWSGEDQTQGIVPIYAGSQEIRSEEIRSWVRQVLPLAGEVVSLLPDEYAQKKALVPLAQAFADLHEPADLSAASAARQRLAYEEIFQFAVASALKRSKRTRERGYAIDVSSEVDRRIRRLFPFSLTPSQDEVIQNIVGDFRSGHPMHRLIQGDVGSGKTAVAIYAILAVVAAGYQAAFMTPTEILARQQFRVLNDYLSRSRVRRQLLVGGLASADRQAILDPLYRGEIDLVVGTHALIQPDVHFARLGLVVIDEQHKFGVRQRAELLQQEVTPHQMVMTATPIPRSLAMTWFGDLDLTALRQGPEGRGKVLTHVVPAAKRDDVYQFLLRRARMGQQSLIVCARIEPTPKGQGGDDLRSAQEILAEVARHAGVDLPIGLVHGKMEDTDKDEAIRRFRRGDTLILVATVVIEVGLDVPNVSHVLIENADRFGLSQLHQIRGRVGRGTGEGNCFLLDYSDDPEGHQRLNDLASTIDGFEIAELDTRSRGAGDPLGERQHGVIRLRVGDFQTDSDLLAQCRKDAEELVAADPALRNPAWARFRRALLDRFAKYFGLALVG